MVKLKEINPLDISARVEEILRFSSYLIYPNKFRFSKVVLAIIIKVANKWLSKIKKKLTSCIVYEDDVSLSSFPECLKDSPVFATKNSMNQLAADMVLSDNEIQCALNYLFKKGSEELKHFVHP